ncbi:MAG TPA: hypothetical protein VMB78_00170 [Dissulfurispiraceae bacterium]|nr:hypothetical protein [Dissulfurispiraceae bacterium]
MPRNKVSGMKNILFAIITIAAAVVLCASTAHAEMKKKVALFPFNDLSSYRLDTASTSSVAAGLLKQDYIELVPTEVVRKKIYEAEPDSLRAGKKDKKSGGGTIRKIQPATVEKVSRALGSDYSVYGDISRSDKKIEIRAYLADSNAKVLNVFTVSAINSNEMYGKLVKMGRDIAAFLGNEKIDGKISGKIVGAAEEEERKYHAMLSSLPAVIGKIEKMSASFPQSLRLKVVLLDLYLNDRTLYANKIFDTASAIVKMYDPANGDDTRFLLYRYLDPYDILAGQYEERGDRRKAIEIRERALRDFSFFSEKHNSALERLKSSAGTKEIKGR